MIVLYDKKQQRIPLKIWLHNIDELESDTLQQALNLTNLPFTYRQVALMPDAHVGYGMPIGGVMAAEETIIPYAVGMDIGCGMRAARTPYHTEDFPSERLKNVLGQIRAAIPQGFDWHKQAQKGEILEKIPLHLPLYQQEERRIRRQLGTLGGGNHFIEIQKDEQNRIWVMIHSGSRNIGKQTAEHFHKKAKEVSRKQKVTLPTGELSFLPTETADGQDYLNAMNWCLDFAYANRRRMMEVLLDILQTSSLDELDVHHNYAVREEHFHKQVWVHRKGATRAGKDERGIIPGSMGTPSYIVKGLGNPESFHSSSHGAGRRMGRRQARRNIPVHQVLEDLKRIGVEISTSNLRELAEEAQQAYKDIDHVMAQQQDLVDVEVKLHPLGVVKG
jgi:tRNA-splicing ligase RtcB